MPKRTRAQENKENDCLLTQICFLNRAFENGSPLRLRCHCRCPGLFQRGRFVVCTEQSCSYVFGKEISKRYLDEKTKMNKKYQHFFLNHKDLRAEFRSILCDWMAEVCSSFELLRQTYYLAIDYVDRYLEATRNVPRHLLQLIGATCLLIASKYEEIDSLTLEQLIEGADKGFTESDILMMEIDVLKKIQWNCFVWTMNDWCHTYLHLLDCIITKDEYKMITDILDISILDSKSLKFTYSSIAASAIYLTLNKSPIPMKSSVNAECSIWLYPYFQIVNNRYQLQTINYIDVREKACPILKNCDITLRYGNNLFVFEEVQNLLLEES